MSCSSVSCTGVVTYSLTSGTGRSVDDDDGRLAAGAPGQVGLEPRGVAERRRHQQELRLRQLDQRHLPGPAAVGIGVEVELVHHDQADVGVGALAQRHVGQDLGGRSDDRGVGVDRGVAGDHADVLGAEDLAQVEELLADQRLDRGGVDAALAAGQRRGHRAGRHEALARAGRRREDDVRAGDALEDRLVLRGIERQAAALDPLGDGLVDGVLVVGRRLWGADR